MPEPRPLAVPPVVVGLADAARMLNTSPDKVSELIREQRIASVPHLSSPKKIAIAVAELQRFANQGVTPTLRAVAS